MINLKRYASFVAVTVSAIVAAACASGSLSCTASNDGTASCTGTVQWMVQKTASSTKVDQYDLASFDAYNLKADTSASNVYVKATSNPSATVRLYNNGTRIATKTFDLAVNGQQLAPANPSAVSTWVQSYSNMVDDMRISYSGVEFETVNGSNNFVMEWYYENQNLGGEADSFYYHRSDDGYCEGPICYDPK